MATKRMLQMAEIIKEHVALMVTTGKLADPRIKDVTIQRVVMTPDMQLAKVYFSVLGDKAQQVAVTKAFKSASRFIRKSFGSILQVRFTPNVVFFYDETIEYSLHMNSVLNQVREELNQSEQSSKEINPTDTESSESEDSSK